MHTYSLIYACIWFVINSDTAYGKCSILRFKIIPLKFYRTISISKDVRNVKKWINWINLINWTVFQVRGPCNLIGGYHVFMQDILPLSSDGLWRWPRMLLQNIYKKYRTMCCTNSCLLKNPHYCGHSVPVPKNMKNNLSVGGNDTFRELNYRRAVCFLQAAFNITYFFHQFSTLGFKSGQKQTEETNH